MFINITLSVSNETIDYLPKISETKDDDFVDDFKEIFNPVGIRIIYFSLWIIFVTLSNAFFALLILYEKYGEDIMKRSISNQLWSQVGLAMILFNSVCGTIFLFRFIFGPLHFGIAVFETCIANSYMSWTLLVLAEISVMKALLIYKFSWIVGIDENFAGIFLFQFNLGYSVIFHTARFVHKFFILFKFYSHTFPQYNHKLSFQLQILCWIFFLCSAFSSFVGYQNYTKT